MYRTLVVSVEPNAVGCERVRAAIELARRYDARLIGVAADLAGAIPPPGAGPILVETEVEARARLKDLIDQAEAQFRSLAADEKLVVDWRGVLARPREAALRAVIGADLLICGREPATAKPIGFARPGDLVMEAGGPVLVAPPNLGPLEAQRVVVGWRNTRECRRAVNDALPLLRRARQTVLASAFSGDDPPVAVRAELDDVAARLRLHGVAVAEGFPMLRGTDAAELLISAADAHGADLIVAGGYGHGRVREWVMGGVTQGLLERCPVYLFLSH